MSRWVITAGRQRPRKRARRAQEATRMDKEHVAVVGGEGKYAVMITGGVNSSQWLAVGPEHIQEDVVRSLNFALDVAGRMHAEVRVAPLVVRELHEARLAVGPAAEVGA